LFFASRSEILKSVLVIELVKLTAEMDFSFHRYFLELKPSKEEKVIEKEVARLEREAHAVNLPSTFMEWAKLKRDAAKREKELLKMREKRETERRAGWRQRISQILGLRQIVLLALLYFIYEPMILPDPLLEVDISWMWPVSHLFSLPNQPAGGLSVIAWAVLTQRLAARIIKEI